MVRAGDVEPDEIGRGSHDGSDVNPLPFIPIAPCRVADTRGNGFGGAYGPPSLVANANRNFTIIGQCGIPTTAAAVSFNFGALNVGGAGDLRVFPGGRRSSPRFHVELQRQHAQHRQRGRRAARRRSDHGAGRRRPIDLIIDVNGYYYDYFSGTGVLGLNEQFNIRTICDGCSGLYGENASTVGGSRAFAGSRPARRERSTASGARRRAPRPAPPASWGPTGPTSPMPPPTIPSAAASSAEAAMA